VTNLLETHSAWIPKEIEEISTTIIGLGHANQSVAVGLVKYGNRFLQVCDFDSVSQSNLTGAFYTSKNVGELKVSSFIDFLCSQSPYNLKLVQYAFFGQYSKYNSEYDNRIPTELTIIGTDSGNSRIECWDYWKKVNQRELFSDSNLLYVDIRLDFDNYEIYFVPNNRIAFENYEQNLKTIVNKTPIRECGQRHLFNTVLTVGSSALRGIIAFYKREFNEFNFIMGNSIQRKENSLIPFKAFGV
jgi:hypothetical protein